MLAFCSPGGNYSIDAEPRSRLAGEGREEVPPDAEQSAYASGGFTLASLSISPTVDTRPPFHLHCRPDSFHFIVGLETVEERRSVGRVNLDAKFGDGNLVRNVEARTGSSRSGP